MKQWTFTLDGYQGLAERYGSKPLEVYILWRGVGCHLSGLIPSAQTVVWSAEAAHDNSQIPQTVGNGGTSPLNENGWTH